MSRWNEPRGFSLLELLVAGAVLTLLSGVTFVHAGRDHSRQQLHQAAQRLQVAIDRGRLVAQRQQSVCVIALTEREPSADSASLPLCAGVRPLLMPQLREGPGVHWHANLPDQLRFTRNGLLLDGGLVVFSHQASTLRPCVVISLPLGVTRQGVYGADPLQALNSSRCRPSS